MKKTGWISLFAILALLFSCQNESGSQTEGDNIQGSDAISKDHFPTSRTDTVLTGIAPHVIDIDLELKNGNENYFIESQDGILSLCCFSSLAFPFGSNGREDIIAFCPNCKVDSIQVEVNGTLNNRVHLSKALLSLTMATYTHEDGHVEHFLADSSYFRDPAISLPNGTRIGQGKRGLLSTFFRSGNDSLFEKLTCLAVSPDERGELYTQYRFSGDTLHSIVWGNRIYPFP